MHDFQEQCQVHRQRSKNMDCRFASSTQREIEKLLEDKHSENTKRSRKVAKELFHEYLKEQNIQEPHEAEVLSFMWKREKSMDNAFVAIFFKTMYNKTISRICAIIQVSENTYLDLD